MSKTFTVEGDITAADTRTNFTTQGSVSAPSSVTPKGTTKIDKIIVACTSEGLAAGAQSYFLRLGGNAIKNGEQVIAVSAAGMIAVQAGSDAAPQLMTSFIIDDADIEVGETDTLTVAMEGAGTDTGTAHGIVTLVFA